MCVYICCEVLNFVRSKCCRKILTMKVHKTCSTIVHYTCTMTSKILRGFEISKPPLLKRTVTPHWYFNNPLTTNDDYSRHRNSSAWYQLAQSVLKIGSVLAERLGRGEVGGCHPEGESASQLLQLAVEKPWSRPGGTFFCFLHKRA